MINKYNKQSMCSNLILKVRLLLIRKYILEFKLFLNVLLNKFV